MNSTLLNSIGLAKKAGMLVVGDEPVGGAARARQARAILLASDAAANTVRRVQHFAETGQCLWMTIPCTKDELGGAVGRSSCAMVALTDVGFACAIVKKLALGDPETYGDAAARLDIKAQRAADRRREQAAHEKNIQLGKKRKPAAPSSAEAAAETPTEAAPPLQAASPARATPKAASPKRTAAKTAPWVSPARPPAKRAAPLGAKPPARPTASAEEQGDDRKPYAFRESRPVKHGRGSPKKGK